MRKKFLEFSQRPPKCRDNYSNQGDGSRINGSRRLDFKPLQTLLRQTLLNNPPIYTKETNHGLVCEI
jgi:hypothetical protein